VSCISARGVVASLDPREFEVVPVGITRNGAWRVVDPAELLDPTGSDPLPSVTGGRPVLPTADPTRPVLMPLGTADPAAAADGVDPALDVDVVFPVLHGPWGEDGTIQGLLELAGRPYVGAGVLASAAAMDKEFTKKLLAAEGVPGGRWAVLRPGTTGLSEADRARLGLPVFVKPARAGSSLGVRRVDDWADFADAVAAAREFDPKVVVEAAQLGREVECGVLELPDGRLEASPIAEIKVPPQYDFYDFQAKYLDDVVTFDIPADLPDVVAKQIRELAVRAFTALDCTGLARVDFFVVDDPDGGDPHVVVNEVNTLPGFTPISMYPRMWAAGGLSYGDLVGTLVRTALAQGTGLR
jgi:D-alanine-D-alanine ligase